MFTQDAQKEIEINGLEFGYNQMYLEEINKLKEENRSKEEALAAKDEKIKADNVARIKRLMKKHHEDFDTVFSDFDLDPSLKEEYRRLVEEKNLSRQTETLE